MASDRPPPAGFLSRWSQRKVRAGQGQPLEEPLPPATPDVTSRPAPPIVPTTQASSAVAADADLPTAAEPVPPGEPAPTLDDVAQLGIGSDYRRFVGADVDVEVKNAALKQLFTDPHFNVMDGLDTYIDDYGRPDPLPAGMLRQMVQAQFVGLFRDEAPTAAEASAAEDVAALPAATDIALPDPFTLATSPAPPGPSDLPALPAPTAANENPDL